MKLSVISLFWVTCLFIQPVSAQWIDVSTNAGHATSPASFPDDNTGYMRSLFPCLFKTVNAGNTWDSIPIPYPAVDLDFLDANNGYALMNNGGQFYLGFTTNGGNSWSMDTMPSGANFGLIKFVNFTTGYASCPGYIYKTINSGNTWTSYNIGYYEATDKEFVGFDTIIFTGRRINFPNWGVVIKSTDGGNTFQSDTMNTLYSDFLGSHFINGSTGLAVYEDFEMNYLVSTTNGGLSWDTILSDSSSLKLFSDVYMVNANESYLTLRDIPGSEGFIYHVTGNTFTNEVPFIPLTMHRLYRGGNTLYAVGQRYVYRLLSPLKIEEPRQFSLSIQPNPANDYLTISLDEKNIRSLSIVDITGKLVYQQINNFSENLTIDLNEFSNGIYLVSITHNTGVVDSKKIVIKH